MNDRYEKKLEDARDYLNELRKAKPPVYRDERELERRIAREMELMEEMEE